MFLDSDGLKVGGQIVTQKGITASGWRPLDAHSTVSNGTGVFAIADFGTGVWAESNPEGGLGVLGKATSSAPGGRGVLGWAINGTGVVGVANTGTGVYGNGTEIGIRGNSAVNGIQGETSDGCGVLGIASTSIGAAVRGINQAGGLAGDFVGPVQIANGPLKPLATNQVSIGTSSLRFSNIYLVNQPQVGSDIRMKKDIQDLPYGLTEVLKLHPVTYRWNSGTDDSKQLGLIAQEVEKIIPDVVIHGKEPSDQLSMRYEALVPVLVKALQEQQARIEMLERGHKPAFASFLSGNLGGSLAIGLLPLGLAILLRKRKSVED